VDVGELVMGIILMFGKIMGCLLKMALRFGHLALKMIVLFV